jgi:hypothetical protein
MRFADRIRQPSTTTGTGSMALGTVAAGYQAFPQVYFSTDRFLYVIENVATGEWEIGFGYVTGSTLVRETPLEGSSAVPVSFGAGAKDCFVAHNAALSSAMHLALFGNGVDGNVVATGSSTLSKDMHLSLIHI